MALGNEPAVKRQSQVSSSLQGALDAAGYVNKLAEELEQRLSSALRQEPTEELKDGPPRPPNVELAERVGQIEVAIRDACLKIERMLSRLEL